MKAYLVLLGVCLGAAFAQAAVTASDSFDDGVRDSDLWQVVSGGARLQESGGVLHGFSGTNNPGSTTQRCRWRMKKTFGLAPGNSLVVEALVRMPDIYPGSSGGTCFIVGLSDPAFTSRAFITVGVFGVQRVAYGTVKAVYTPNYPLPPAVSRFRVRMKYAESTGIMKFYIAEPGGDWQFLGSKNLASQFGPVATPTRKLVPYLEFGSLFTTIQLADNLWLDTFSATLQ